MNGTDADPTGTPAFPPCAVMKRQGTIPIAARLQEARRRTRSPDACP